MESIVNKFPCIWRGRGSSVPVLPLVALGIIGVLMLVFFAGTGAQASGAQPGGAVAASAGGSCKLNPQPGGAPGQLVQTASPSPTPVSTGVQDVYIKALALGRYDNSYVRVNANQPVRLHFSADPRAGCGRSFIMRDFGVRLVSQNGAEQVAEFTPGPGKYEFSCSMRMFRGTLEAA